MKSYNSEKKEGLKVGQIIDAMNETGEFKPLGREDIFAIVEIFLKDYVGLPQPDGTLSIVTRKFTKDEAQLLAVQLNIPLELVVKVITTFRIKAGAGSGVQSKLKRIFTRSRISGGGMRPSLVSRL